MFSFLLVKNYFTNCSPNEKDSALLSTINNMMSTNSITTVYFSKLKLNTYLVTGKIIFRIRIWVLHTNLMSKRIFLHLVLQEIIISYIDDLFIACMISFDNDFGNMLHY